MIKILRITYETFLYHQFDQAFTVSAASKIYTLTERAMLKYEVMETTTAWQTVFRELILHGIMYPKCIRLLETRVTKALLKMMGITPPNTCRNGRYFSMKKQM